MSLDSYPGDAEILRKKQEWEARQRGSRPALAIVPGPNSVLLEEPTRTGRKPKAGSPGTRRREHAIQVEVFVWANDPAEQLRHPELAMLHAVPNGGHRTPAAAKKMKAEGQKPGVPDLDLPVGRGGYLGLRIEIKRPGGTTSPEQADWMAALAREGHKVALHTTVMGVKAEILAYLAMPRTVGTVAPLTPPLPASA
jgi:hypothetical protein